MTPNPADDFELGATVRSLATDQRVFGRYTLKRILGRGGMGVVWLARDGELEQDVALKFLPETVATDREALHELRRETRRSRELTHPHIVRIHDFVRDERAAAISMEYVEGDTLANLRAERPGRMFEVEHLRRWLPQLCGALDYAHGEARVVHRDLKPANLMVDGRERLKVADFGIAATMADTATRVSKMAGASGTPVYMSPQQMMGEKPAATDDIYSLGATLYELLTGKPPFHTGNLIAQVQAKVPPSMAERRAELGVSGEAIPRKWEETIAACLAKESSARPQSAGEVAERLGLTAGTAPKPAPATPAKAPPAAPAPAAPPDPLPPPLPPVARPAPAPAGAEPERGNRKSHPVRLALGAAAAVVVVGLTYYFGVHAPEQQRREESSRLEAEALRLKAEQERAAEEALRRAAPPQEGQRWTVPTAALAMEWVAPGVFSMGSTNGGSDEQPVTRVRLTRGFWLGKTEVTQGQWSAVMGGNPSSFMGENLPVENVSWDDVTEFCRKVTEAERAAGRLPAGYAYTLPTEAQWEYACRAGTSGEYAGELDAMGWYVGNSGGKTNPVGQKRENAWGLQDMHGNVWEWCLDWYGDKLPGGSVSDPRGPETGSFRVLRGGGWFSDAAYCRSAYRSRVEPGFRNFNLGFRLALSEERAATDAARGATPPREEQAGAAANQKERGTTRGRADMEKQTLPEAGRAWENTLGMKFVPVPETGLLFCIWETRVQDFEAFVRETGYDATDGMVSDRGDGWKRQGDTWQSPGFPQGPTHPVVGLNQADAKAFCAWLTQKERAAGRLDPNQVYRLPTDAEWDAAVEREELFPWGEAWPPPPGAGNYADEAAKRGRYKSWPIIEGYDDGYDATAPVGSFAATRHGLYDVGGNVFEFVEDQKDKVRGASFRVSSWALISTSQPWYDPIRSDHIGFRVVCAVGSAR